MRQHAARRLPLWAASALAVGLVFAAHPARAFDVPQRVGYVNDFASMMPSDAAQRLDQRLQSFYETRGLRFALITVPTLNGVPIEEYAIKVGDAWQVANRRRDKGLLMVIARDDRKLRIEVGYGLEGAIPDAVAARVTREILAPALKQGDAAGGIEAAFDTLIQAAGGDGGAAPATRRAQPRRETKSGLPIGLLITLAGFLIFNAFTGVFSRRRRGGGFFFLPMGGGFGGGGGGSWGGGGGGGGGDWGGGGGGGSGFGGGGASGDW